MISLEQEIEKRRKIVEEKEHKVAEANRAVVDAEYDVNTVAKELAELVAKRDTLTAHLIEAKKHLEEVKAIDISKIEAELDMLNGILMEQQEEEKVEEEDYSEVEKAEEPEEYSEVEQPVECEECEVVPEVVEEPVVEYVPEEPDFTVTPVVEEQPVEVHYEAPKHNGDPFGGMIDRINF